jgi:hypothetical protein
VGDDDAGHIGLRDQLVDAPGQRDPHAVVHVLRADVGDLFAPQTGQTLRLRHRGEQLFDADLAGGVARLDVARGGPGDGAAGRQHDVGQFVGGERRRDEPARRRGDAAFRVALS